MPNDVDPYRTLGLDRGASLDEVKRAYRRLAKIHHPDAAGEKALPRFLAIQAAYEQLLGGSFAPSRVRRGSAPRRSWQSDQDRGDATRRAYGGRARSTPPGASRAAGAPPGSGRSNGSSAGTRPGAGASTGPGAGRSSGSNGSNRPGAGGGASGGGASAGAGAGGRPGGRRPAEPRGAPPPPPNDTSRGPGDGRRKAATLGSTSYDGADAGPFEPDWGGASWYGTTSGTYWTLNPKEYADPRKHGPEYQARARRSAQARAADPGAPPGPTSRADAASTGGSAETTAGDGAEGPAAGPTHTTASWWDSTAGPTGSAGPAARPDPYTATSERTDPSRARSAAALDPPPPDLGRAAADIGRALTDERFGGMRGRLFRAVVGWLPIALGLGWAVGELTGCGRFAASCDGGVDPFLMFLQVAVLGVLLLLPAAASVATMAATALLGAAVVAALTLSATGAAADGDARRAALGVVLLIAWLGGLAVAIVRRARTLPSRAGPVS